MNEFDASKETLGESNQALEREATAVCDDARRNAVSSHHN